MMVKLLRLVAWRTLTAALTVLGVSLLIFVAVDVLPGDVATRVLGRQSTQAQREAFRERVGLNDPFEVRYMRWLGGALRGDLGKAYTTGHAVSELIAPRLRNTLLLSGLALLMYFPVTGILATLAALSRGRPLDGAVQGLTLIGLSIPEFVQGTLLLLLFGVAIPVLPVISQVDRAKSPGELLAMLIMPAIVLTSAMSMYAIRMLRDNLVEVLDATYIRMARLRGLSRWQVAVRHALPNALLPALNITALNLTWLIGGVVIIERVFAFPGFGSLLVDSIAYQDAPLIEATVLIATIVYVAANLVTDVLSILLTPKLRTG
jgi:peptide/nickel transport system permease protein